MSGAEFGVGNDREQNFETDAMVDYGVYVMNPAQFLVEMKTEKFETRDAQDVTAMEEKEGVVARLVGPGENHAGGFRS